MPLNLELNEQGNQLTATLREPLVPDAEYVFRLAPELTDLEGNGLAKETTIQFRTGSFRLLSPFNGQQFIEGQTVSLEAGSSEDIGLESVRFFVSGEEIAVATEEPFQADYLIPSSERLEGITLDVVAEGLSDDGIVLVRVSASIGVSGSGADDDGDGLSNELELSIGTNPFLADADLDPDADGVLTGVEVAMGTDPFRGDTDGDSHLDGDDIAPLLANQIPVLGVPRRGKALSFDGNDVVQIATKETIRAAAGTIEFSFQPANLEGTHHLFYIGASGDGFGGQTEFHINVRDDFLQWVNHEGETLWVLSGGQLLPGEMHHVAVVWDQGKGFVRLYLDGALVDSGEYQDFSRAWPEDIRLGQHSGSGFPERGYSGLIDQLRIWRRARTQQEIREYRLREPEYRDPDLVGWFTLDSGEGNRVYNHAESTVDGLLADGGNRPEWVDSKWEVSRVEPVCVVEAQPSLVSLSAFDQETLLFEVLQLPLHGQVFQVTDAGELGSLIDQVPFAIEHPEGHLFLVSDTSEWVTDEIMIGVSDGQDSATALVPIIRLPAGEAPVAGDDTVAGFQGASVVMANLLENDIDPEGDSLRILHYTQANNGLVESNELDQLVYTPAPGFAGTDQFQYLVADRVGWMREHDYVPGSVLGSMNGNPGSDAQGLPAWTSVYVRGGNAESEDPWYANRGSLMVWDDSYFVSFRSLWARGDDLAPAISATLLTHVLNAGDDVSLMPVVRWTSPYDSLELDMIGSLDVLWTGIGDVGSPVDVEVVVAQYDRASGDTIVLQLESLSKPSAEDSVGEIVSVSVDLKNLPMNKGDEFVFSLRAKDVVDNRWVSMTDQIAIVPRAARQTAVVTVNLGENSAPVALAVEPEQGLLFDGIDGQVSVSDQSLSVEGAFTVMAWFMSDDDFSADSTTNHLLTKSPNGASGGCDYCLSLGPNQSLSFRVTSASGQEAELTSRPLSPGWHHVAGVHDSEAGMMELFVDGRRVDETSVEGSVRNSNAELYFGTWNETDSQRRWHGMIDEIALWSRALSRNEILDNFFNRIEIREEIALNRLRKFAGNFVITEEDGLLAYWRFSEGGGEETLDAVRQIPGHLNGGVEWVESFAPFSEAVVVDQAVVIDQDHIVEFKLEGLDLEEEPLSAFVTQLTIHGDLFQEVENEGIELQTLRDNDFADSIRRGVFQEVYEGIQGNSLVELFAAPSFPEQPSSATNNNAGFESPVNLGDNYGLRMAGFIDVSRSGFYTFWISGTIKLN